MTIPGHQILINDNSEKKYPFRNDNTKLKKPFIFKGYKTEEERIKETIKSYKSLYGISNDQNIKSPNLKTEINEEEDIYNFDIPNQNPNQIKKRSSIIEEEKIKDILKNNILIQPEMRFKARTDLERIYDALIEKNFRLNEKQIIERQLKNLNLNSYQTPELIKKKLTIISKNDENKLEEEKRKYKIKPNPLYEEAKKKEREKNSSDIIYGEGKLYYNPKKLFFKPWQKNLDLNSEAEGILSEYHIKTHFKACAEVAENKINSNLKFHKKSKSMLSPIKEILNNENKKKLLNIKSEDFNDKDYEIEYDDYNKNKNPYNEKYDEKIDPDSLKVLSNLAFSKDSIIRGDTKVVEQYIPTGKKNKYYHKRKLVDENSVLIDGKILFKDSQFDIIASKVLNICHVNRKKSQYNNSNLKKKKGKLMITKGLSVDDFEKKYKI
jgi:hypothetical protein